MPHSQDQELTMLAVGPKEDGGRDAAKPGVIIPTARYLDPLSDNAQVCCQDRPGIRSQVHSGSEAGAASEHSESEDGSRNRWLIGSSHCQAPHGHKALYGLPLPACITIEGIAGFSECWESSRVEAWCLRQGSDEWDIVSPENRE